MTLARRQDKSKARLRRGLKALVAGCLLMVMMTGSLTAQATSPLTHTQGTENPSRTINENYLHLRITHTLTAAVFAAYIADGNKTDHLTYFAEKNYLLTFLNVWSQLIESDRFTSSQQIFAEIKASKGFLAKHFSLWEGLTADKGLPSINLGFYRNTALAVIFRSELMKRPAHERMAELLDRLHFLLLSSSKDYALMRGIAAAFLGSEDPKLDQRARDVIENIHPLKGLEVLNVFRDPLKTGRVAKTAERAIGLARQSLPFIRRAQGASNVSRGTQTLNPIWERLAASGMKGGMVGSIAVHGALAGVAAGASLGSGAVVGSASRSSHQGQGASALSEEASSSIPKTPFAASLAMLWSITQAMSPGLHSNDYQDFAPKIETVTAAQLTNQIQAVLGGMKDGRAATWIDYLKVFLQAEKIAKIDHRPIGDPLAMEFSFGRLHLLEKRLIQSLQAVDSPNDRVELLRKTIIERELRFYKRDYASLTSVTLGFGGNCVAQTMLLVGMLKRLEHRIQYPEQMKLGVALFKDHIEAVLYNDEKVSLLVSGDTLPRDKSIVYRPEFLLFLVLTNFKTEKSLRVQKFLDASPLVIAERALESDPESSRQLKVEKSALAGLIARYRQIWAREGVLDQIPADSPTTWDGELSVRQKGPIPEEAIVEFKGLSPSIVNNFGRENVAGSATGRNSDSAKSIFKVKVDTRMAGNTVTTPFIIDPATRVVFVGTEALKVALETIQRGHSSDAKDAKALADTWLSLYHREVARLPSFLTLKSTIESISDLKSILEIKDADLRLLDQIFTVASFESETVRGNINQLLDQDLCLPNRTTATPFSALEKNEYDLSCENENPSPWNQLFMGAKDKPMRIRQEISTDIPNFVALLQKATDAQRIFMLEFVNRPIRLAMSDYLQSLTKVGLISASQNCVKRDIDLPSVESTDSTVFYIVPNTCSNAMNVLYERSTSGGTPMLDKVLVELSHLTMSGFHLWTPQLVNALIENRMGYSAERHQSLLIELANRTAKQEIQMRYPHLAPLKALIDHNRPSYRRQGAGPNN